MILTRKIETIILNQLIWNHDYFVKILPFIKSEYFDDSIEKVIVKEVLTYYTKYNSKISNPDVLKVCLDQNQSIQSYYEETISYIDGNLLTDIELTNDEKENWLMQTSEKFIKDKALYLAIVRCINISDGKEKDVSTDVMPDILEEALGLSFDTDVGHNFIDDAEKRFDLLHRNVSKYPCSLDSINKIIDNGFEEKTLNVFAGSPGAGKSILLAQLAKDYSEDGYNVLFISLEMAAEKIATRIDANSMDINVNRIKYLEKNIFLSKINTIKNKSKGTIIIKEYPPSSINCNHIESLIKELKIKKNFVPKVLIVDYIGIMRPKNNSLQSNLYLQGKAIAEELRAVMVKHNLIGISVVQFNRGSAFSSEAGHSGIAESSAIEHTVDFLAGLVITEELREQGKVILQQMKNRYGDVNLFKKQMIGLDTNKMRYYDLDETETEVIEGHIETTNESEKDVPLFDKSTNFGTLKKVPQRNFGKISI